ncbi:unnamed protein product [Brassica oleracea var. botrytis]|uniref:Uncharacterized protein n=4 Tax=Brassica TaxID=3705 RepID=A0A8S9JKX6_BRACR|nr:uncharacterized protein BNAC05G24990D [Brassica napus]KAF2583210.1 hypothetical protein F2Q68_00006226 [Brassica cretica]VDD44431.1 unnamed protein product [Brassica oleracea]KAF3507992.1 hypothetical protein F2Q69_00009109 [Brassica cretica]KAF3551246.1 hypothetical protein DY000_02009570 [Brassica cretica]CAF1929295.1 unnamed protein product [Brassica napus]
MLLVTVLAEMLKEYTVVLAGVLEHLFSQAPFPRRIRLHILYSLPFHNSSSSLPLLLPSPPPYARTL